jgi:hypothetical protein
MDSEIAHLEDLLDLFRQIDALTESAVALRQQVNEQMVAARKREGVIDRAAALDSKVLVLGARKQRKPLR